jgi:predicted dehydrogenase
LTTRLAFIGAGGVCQFHLEALQEVPEAKVVAVADISPEAGARTADRWGIPEVYRDYRRMLQESEIDAVLVCTPSAHHAKPAIAALRAGKHVLVEKPIDASFKKATELVRVALETDRVLTVGVRLRFSPHLQAARRIIASGALGRVYFAEATAGRRRGAPGGSFLRRDLGGIGVTGDLGIYALDAVLHLMGDPRPLRVSALTSSAVTSLSQPVVGQMSADARGIEVEDFAAAWVRLEGGAALLLKTSWSMHMDALGGTFLLGEKGGLRFGVGEVESGVGDAVHVYRDEAGVMTDTEVRGLPPHEFIPSFRGQDRAWLAAIKAGGPSPVDPVTMLQRSAVIDAITRSAKKGREVEVEVPNLGALAERTTRDQKAAPGG